MTPARVMAIPTSAEVETYAVSIGFKIDGGYFVDYWEQRGWFVKPGIPMRSWQATVRNWQRMENAKAGGSMAPSQHKCEADARREEAASRRMQVVAEAASRIRAMMSWLKSGDPCPWSKDPQAEIDDEVAKIRDHYGERGVSDLREKVKELGRKTP